MPDAVKKKPLRMSFTNLDTGDALEAQFNPEELKEMLSVNWNELETLGASFKPHQYQNTGNMEWQFRLEFNAFDEGGGGLVTTSLGQQRSSGATQNRQEDILAARRYLLSMAYKQRGAQDIIGGSPSRYLFVWPNLCSVNCLVHRVRLTHQQFDQQGRPMRFMAEISIKEGRLEEIFSDDVFSNGTFRNEDVG